MGYSYNAMLSELKRVREKASAHKAHYEAEKNKVLKSYPELSDLETSLMQIGAKAGVAALAGDEKALSTLKSETLILKEKTKALYKKAGFYEYAPICPKCGDIGYIGKNFCSCVYEEAKRAESEEFFSTLPDDISFSSFLLSYYPEKHKSGIKKIFDLSKNFAENFSGKGESLLFMGGTGLGKTHLSLSIARRVLERGFEVVYRPADRLFNEIEKEHFSYADTSPNLDRALNCDLLIIDDLGTEFSTKFTLSIAYNIINERILRKKPTVINTNLSVDELESRYGERILSRLIGEYTVKQFKGEDIRPKKKAAESV